MSAAQELPVMGAGDWIGTLVVGGAFSIGVGVSLLLFVLPSPNRRAALLLGTFLVAASSTVLGQLIANLGLGYRYPGLEFVPLNLAFALGPLLYLYIRARVDSSDTSGRGVRMHALLPAAHVLFQVWVWTSPPGRRAWFYETVYGPWGSLAEDVFFTLSLVGYLGASWLLLRPNRRSEEVRAAPSLQSFLALLGLALVVTTIFNFAVLLLPSGWMGSWVGLVEELSYSLLVGWLAWIVLSGWLGHTVVSEEIPSRRTERYGLSPEDIERQAEEVTDLVMRLRLHLDPELTLSRMAEELEMSEKVLSLVLNEGVGRSYRDYINGLRVDEAKGMLADPARQDQSVLVVGMEAGFSSKATFNRIFKQFTDITPTEYRKRSGS